MIVCLLLASYTAAAFGSDVVGGVSIDILSDSYGSSDGNASLSAVIDLDSMLIAATLTCAIDVRRNLTSKPAMPCYVNADKNMPAMIDLTNRSSADIE